jgi:hypothetical protein
LKRTSGPLARGRLRVQQLRDELLAGAGLAAHQHRHVAAGHPRGGVEQPPHRPRVADDPPPQRALGGQRLVGHAQRAGLERALDHHRDLVDVERLGQVVVGAGLDRRHRDLLAAVGGEQDHRQARVARGDRRDQLEPAHARHLQIGHHHRGVVELRQRGGARRRGQHAVPALGQHLAQRVQHAGLVVDEQHRRRDHAACPADSGWAWAGPGAAGSRTVTVVPRPGALS